MTFTHTMDFLADLNPQQNQAVTAPPGPTLVLAGPGSGKTRVLTHRIAHLIAQGVPPWRILAVTFTNKAARQMRQRVGEQLQGAIESLAIGTFHATCARILHQESACLRVTHDFVIYDSADQLAMIKEAMEYLELDAKRFSPQRIHGAISNAKNELIGPYEYQTNTYFGEISARVYDRYQFLLQENNALDFDDLLMNVVEVFRDYPDVLSRYRTKYTHVLVDEFQDTNIAQYEILQLLTGRHRQLYVVADPDQSIYRWRGADYRNVQRFEDEYPDAQVYKLEQNYRSTQAILDSATAVISKNPGRTPKKLFTERQGGARLRIQEAYDRKDEAKYVVETIASLTYEGQYDPGDCAIMYRTNAQSRALEEAFIRASLPYRLVGATRFYARREIKDMLAFLRLVHNPRDTVSLYRIMNVPPRGIGAKSLDVLRTTVAHASVNPAEIMMDLATRGRNSPYFEGIGERLSKPLASFGHVLVHLIAEKENCLVSQLIDHILEASGYENYIKDDSQSGEERWNNVMELRSEAVEFHKGDLAAFLEDIALVSEVDNLSDEDGAIKAPTLQTLHAAKGLEFPVVFIVGLEDGVLPHQRSFEDDEEMAEERRLFYVGLTRAKDQVIMTHSFRGQMYGDEFLRPPSRFLEDIPEYLLTGDVGHLRDGGRRDLSGHPRLRHDAKISHASESLSIQATQFDIGQRVEHAEFGEGVVLESKSVGGDEMVTVAFEDMGIKRLIAGMANLNVLSG